MGKFQFISCVALGLAIAGCAPMMEGGAPTKTYIYAMDTSGSAMDKRGAYFGQAMDEMMRQSANSRLIVFRFDARPAETFAGEPPNSMEQAAHVVKSTIDHTTPTKGTNLLKLMQLIESSVQESPGPESIRIYTDCGVELMTADEREATKLLADRLLKSPKAVRLTFVGVDNGFRESLREMFPWPPERLDFETL